MEEVVKEEAYEIAQSGNREKDAFVSKCPGCGANLTYAAEKECLECSHCGTEVKFVFAPSRKFEFARLL